MLSQTLQQRRELKEEEQQQTSTEQRLRPRQDRTVGKRERHNKVFTSKGVMRDRRVRLSAHTAIRFYDIQDQLGFDQPSRAIDWLIDKAKSAIDTLHHPQQQQQRSINVEADHERIESTYEDPYVFDSLLSASLLSILASDDDPPIRVRDHDDSDFTEGYFSSGGFVGI